MTVAVAAPRGCSRCASPLEDGDLRCAVCALPVPVTAAPVERARVLILRCTWCGAAVGFDANHQAPACGFCRSVMKVEQPVDPVEVATQRLPFAVDRELAAAALRTWLGKRGYFAPATLRDEAVLESLTPLCWAAWIVNAEATVAWAADSDQGSRRSAWAPHAGQVKQTFSNIVVPASRGLRHEECSLLVPYYDLARAVVVDAPELPDAEPTMIESFDAQRSAARALVQRAIEEHAKRRVQKHGVPGTRFRNVHVSCLLERQTTDRVALPAWVLAYRFRGSPYRAIVHGQRPEIVFGRSPIDWAKVTRLAGTILVAIAAILALVLLLSGCGSSQSTPDATDYTELCVAEQPTFTPLTGRAAVKAALNVHIDAGGLIMTDTTSEMLLALELTQTGTQVAVRAEVCHISIPDVPLAGQDLPIHFEIPQATVESVGVVAGNATLESADATCGRLDTEPITLVLGARLDPVATAPLPAADDSMAFPACAPTATTPCSTAIGTGCACDQEADGQPGATLIARNVPAIELDQVYVTLRTTFSLHGKVWSTDFVKGKIEATLETGILACKLLDGTMCGPNNLRTVRTLNPIVTPQLNAPSTFRAVRVAASTTCAEIIANQAKLFPR
ncbi:MAG TPA: hypothetical protein VIV11_05945 [Kofleriaceae bacterium]